MLRQLFQNLIGNALKYRAETRDPIVRILATEESSSCILTINDNGVGFEESAIDRAFQPFVRLHSTEFERGSGIGLSICRRVVERHGGSIQVKSTPGEGSTFFVRVPSDRVVGWTTAQEAAQ